MPAPHTSPPMSPSLYLVLGGRVCDPHSEDFATPDDIDLRGVYASYDEAFSVWHGIMEATVEDACVKYKIIRLT